MIYFAEINKSSQDHVSFNQGIVEILKNNPYGCDLTFFCDSDYYREIVKENDRNISHKRIRIVNGNWSVWALKLLLDVVNLFYIFSLARKRKARFIFFSSIFPITYYFFGIIRRFYWNVDVIIALHGELHYIKNRRFSKNFVLGLGLRNFLSKVNDRNTYFIVLSAIIKYNLGKYLNNVGLRLFYIDHPFIFSEKKAERSDNRIRHELSLGIVGYSSLKKRSNLIFDLADNFVEEIKSGRLNLKIIGKLMPDLLPFVNDNVDILARRGPLSIESYQDEIRKLDYIVFFYDNDIYELSPSGVFLDAIEYEKPILALRSDIVSFYFDKFGNIGFLTDDFESLVSRVRSLVEEFNACDYQVKLENLRKAKEELSIINVSNHFWKEFSSFSV